MKRIRLVNPDHPEEKGFVNARLLAEDWKAYIRKILKNFSENNNIDTIVSNIAHRMQHLEFIQAILYYELENKKSLHETFLRILILQYVVMVNSILEGIGSIIYKSQNPKQKKFHSQHWKTSLVNYINKHNTIPDLSESIEKISSLRDEIHLDRIEENDQLQFHKFTCEIAFIPTVKTFQKVLELLNFNLAENSSSIIFEKIPEL